MIDRKHQVFVSSTYKDLIEERQHVIHALLELDCIPAGMELFPAADEDAWTLIKEVIDGCDYYILIIAGKYGSLSKEGISYTEKEFDYASSINKPIICFLHENIDSLVSQKTEKTEELQQKLAEFKEKAQLKHCKYWSSAEDLGGKVSRSMVQLKKRHPSDGWIPGKYAADESLFATIEQLRKRIDELQNEANETWIRSEIDATSLAQGKDIYTMHFNLANKDKEQVEVAVGASWDRIFSYVGTSMVGECTEEEFREKIQLVYWHTIKVEWTKYNTYDDMIVKHADFDIIKVQLQALQFITAGKKRRAVSDKNTYWSLTPKGESYLIQIRAIRK